MRGYRWMIAILALAPVAALAQQPETSPLVRLSFVQGQVRVLQGNETLFDQAQANMPLLKNYELATGDDGQAEIEFTDGSVARIAPNSELKLDRIANPDKRDDTTEMTLDAGLGYFELNTAYGQRFKVHFADAEARPETNSIFRIDLDQNPGVAVFSGSVHASGDGLDRTVAEGSTLSFNPGDAGDATETASIQQNSWDQWNQDRDNQIAQEAQQQTTASESSQAAAQPGWGDLDQYGDWYPVQGYGNVWVPSDQPDGWDPFGYGYWATYPGWGSTWISGYSWGWLPYRCGAWNYWNSVGWGWIPSQCGVGWYPVVTVLNGPPGYRPPIRPRPIPGGHIGPPSVVGRIIPVNRGPMLPRPGIRNQQARPIEIGGQRINPLPVANRPMLPPLGGRITGGGPAPGVGFMGGVGNARRVTPPLQGQPTRPVYRSFPGYVRPSPPSTNRPSPSPRMAAPMPRMESPRMSAPAPPMHMGGGMPSGGGHH